MIADGFEEVETECVRFSDEPLVVQSKTFEVQHVLVIVSYAQRGKREYSIIPVSY